MVVPSTTGSRVDMAMVFSVAKTLVWARIPVHMMWSGNVWVTHRALPVLSSGVVTVPTNKNTVET